MVLCACTQAADNSSLPAGEREARGRITIPIVSDWRFYKGQLEVAAATGNTTKSADWDSISIPHTWNAIDGQSGGKGYFRGDGWYRRELLIPSHLAGKRFFLKFEGANRRAEIFLNGQRVGAHTGGTEAFIFDISPFANIGPNELVVHVDNKRDPDSAPLQADFTFFGGLYRPAELIAVDPVHISLSDFGSPGVYITTPEIQPDSAKVLVKTLVDQTPGKHNFTTRVEIQILDASGKTVAREISPCPNADGSSEVATTLNVPSPHLWNGIHDPYLYSVQISVQNAAGELLDSITQPLGIRTIALDREKGFFLNGKSYPLYGVSRHQDRQDKGWAISEQDHLQDMAIIKEMGCTSIRLPHYPHSDFFYTLCDKNGLVVWAEIPVVDRLGSSQAFTDNARQQYAELIKQNFNHPSIAFWSAGNEVDENGSNFNKAGPEVYSWFKKMTAYGHELDPSRFTAAAFRERFFPPPDVADVFGLNIYLGWYNNTYDDVEDYLQKHAANGARGKFAVTEYGAGGSIYFHSEHPVRMDHSEEYENLYHEHNWNVLKQHPEVWGKYVWNMFDFASNGRSEGDHAGINDKGLVTYDRKVKKDAFYFYKANWSDEPTVYITSRRFTVRGLEFIPVKVYSNAANVTLRVNGRLIGEKTGGNAVFTWESVRLNVGENLVQASADFPTPDGPRHVTDEVTFTYTPGAPLEVDEPQDAIMRKKYINQPPRAEPDKAQTADPTVSKMN